MPFTAVSPFKLLPFDNNEYVVLPEWAHNQYKKFHTTNYQLITKMVNLDNNVDKLEAMAVKGECPRSIKINVSVQVSQEHQNEMDNAKLECTKLFEQGLLKALITVRRKELVKAKQDIEKHQQTFQKYLADTILEMQQNNVPTFINDEDIGTTIEKSSQLFKSRTEKTLDIVRSSKFFKDKAAEIRLQQKREREQEDRINQELLDPQTRELKDRINKMERQILQLSKVSGRRNLSDQSVPGTKTQKQSRLDKFASRPKGQGSSRRPTGKKDPRKKQDVGKPPRDQGRGNPRPSRRFTNTTTRSGSRQKNSRRNRN